MARSEIRYFLLRGLARESRHWGSFVPLLASLPGTASVVAMDLPGTGTNYYEPPRHDLKATLSFLTTCYQEDLAYEGPKCLIGISLGGMLTWEWLRQSPDLFSHAVLVNSSFAGLSPLWERLTPFALKQFARVFQHRHSLRARESIILEMVSNRDVTAETLQTWEHINWDRYINFVTIAKQLWLARSCQFKPFPANTQSPKGLVLCSNGDRMVNPRASRKLAAATGFAFAAHPDAGHDIPLDDPDWLAQVIHRFTHDQDISGYQGGHQSEPDAQTA